MSNYAGILFKHEDFHVIGPFRFPIMKALLPAERRGMRDFEAAEAQASLGFMKLAKRIGKEKEMTAKQVFEILQAGNADHEIVFEYAEEMQALNAAAPDPLDKVSAFVTLFMQTRGEAQLDEDSGPIRTPDWEDHNTEQIPMNMQQEIYQFILWERNGWPTARTEGNGPRSTLRPTPGTSTK